MNLNPLSWFRTKRKPLRSPPIDYPRAFRALQDNLRALEIEERTRKRDSDALLIRDAFGFDPGYSNLVSPWQLNFDGNTLLFPIFPGRLDGRVSSNYLYITEPQLDIMRMIARYTWELYTPGKGPFQTLRDFVIKTGYEYVVQPRPGSRASDGLVKMAQKHLDDVFNANGFWELESELYIRANRDGDGFLRFFPEESGITHLDTTEPEQIRNPYQTSAQLNDGSVMADWSFGVRVNRNRRSVPISYAVLDYSDGAGSAEIVDADDIVHYKLNVDRVVKRGLSTLFSTQEMLVNAAKLLRAGVLGESARAAIAFLRQHVVADEATMTSFQTKQTDYQLPSFTTTGESGATTPGTYPVSKIEPGSVEDIPDGMDYKPPPLGDAQNATAFLKASYQMLASQYNVPVWVVSGEMDAGSYAESLTAEAPFVRNIEHQQKYFGEKNKKVAHKVLAIAAGQGLLPQDVLEQVEVQVVCPSPVVRNQLESTKRRVILRQEELVSGRTIAEEEGYDYDHERENMKKEPPPPKNKIAGDLPSQQESGTAGAQRQREENREDT